MHITEKGQVTIPIVYRRRLGLLPHTQVEFVLEKGRLVLKKAARAKNSRKPSRGESLVKHLRGSATVRMSTEDIMRLTRGEDWNQA